MKEPCGKCFKNRKCQRMIGPKLPIKGMMLCRPCTQALKFALKEKEKKG